MYVSYLLDKEVSMYPSSRHSGLNLGAQNFVNPPQYPDYGGYHHVPGVNLDNPPQCSGSWPSPYGPPREEWGAYATGPANIHPLNTSPGTISYSPAEYNPAQTLGSGVIQTLNSNSVEQISLNSQRRNPYDWMKKPNQSVSSSGKTRTKDKYRVVYTDHQRLELEKEFHYSRYITIRRKSELSIALGLSERQVKIWFQNRRAKERKIKKKMQQSQSDPVQSGSAQLSPVSALGSTPPVPVSNGGVLGPNPGVLSAPVSQ
ncbi:homeobox protein CDX-1 [Latimeria chalumnae]|uniref:Caudal type homeobox 2 n=2 Tax=Latimeria TaxID=7896 RepID=H3BAU2_LATCH|nr:PREDICTED: homeobox protein CDX-2 [Latimeria chalumnae]AGK27896.1 caudal type homeobox 2 [Latimeria menadoensis]|eukprot:XP_005993018.1 PREDICTED: homeobox protein CDX-2 [Latimeria chalumnae]